MKHLRSSVLVAISAVLILTTATGAIARRNVLSLDTHRRSTPASMSMSMSSGNIQHISNIGYKDGSDLEFGTIAGRDYVFAGRLGKPALIIEVSDPRHPRLVAEIPCELNQNDIQVRNTIVVLAADVSSKCKMASGEVVEFRGFATVDVSDPRNPKVIGIARIPRGAHNVTVHPFEPLVYVSDADLEREATMHIWDISHPSSPSLVLERTYYPIHSPHDITFNADGTRAYSASISHTDIWNTSNARDPKLITAFVHPQISISHQADPSPDGRYLYVTDEVGGGTNSPICPGGGVHVFDLENERVPKPAGIFWANFTGTEFSPSHCTSHVFRLSPDGRTMAIAWYKAGVHVFDLADLRPAIGGSGAITGLGVKTVGAMKMPGADTWAAKMWQRHPGFVFANDWGRGFDVFFVPALAS